MKKKIIIGISLLLVCFIGIGVVSGGEIKVETLKAEKINFQETIEEEGDVVAKATHTVFSEITGVSDEVFIKEGDYVASGDILFTLDKTSLLLEKQGLEGQLIVAQGSLSKNQALNKHATLQVQQAAVNNADTVYKQALVDYNRLSALYESGGVSQSELEQAKLAVTTAERRLKMEKSTLVSQEASVSGQLLEINAAIAKLDQLIEKCDVRAKRSGYVTDFQLESGEAVQMMISLGAIIPVDQTRIEVMVLAEKAYSIAIGDSVEIKRDRAGSEDLIKGQVVYIGPNAVERVSALGLKEKRVKVEIELIDSISPALIVGSQVDVDFVVYNRDDVIVVPKTALFFTDKGDALWLLEGDTVKMNPVVVGYESSRMVEILEGLEEGDQFIRYYDDEGIEEGIKVK